MAQLSNDPAAVIGIVIAGAAAAIVLAASIYSVVSRTTVDEFGQATRQRDPHEVSPEQAKHLREVRESHNKQVWEVAKAWRRQNRMPIPNWYPGSDCMYPPRNQLVSQQDSQDSLSNVPLTPHHPRRLDGSSISCQKSVDHPISEPNTPSNNVDDDVEGVEYSAPSQGRFDIETGIPLKRWTQHGAPRQSSYLNPHITLNDGESDVVEFGQHDHLRKRPTGPYPRSSSVYSHSLFASVSSDIDQSGLQMPPPVAYTGPPSPRRQVSRVHQMIEQWEMANGSFSRAHGQGGDSIGSAL